MASTFPQRQRAGARLRIRKGSPATTAETIGYIEAGGVFDPVGIVVGEAVSGNANWYVLADKRFIWSGASTPVDTVSSIAAPAAMQVRRRPDGSIAVLSDDERASVFGKFEYKEAIPKGAIKIDPAWVAANIISIDTPILAHTGFDRVKVHAKAATAFQSVFHKIAAAGLEDRIKTCAGTWVARHMGWDPTRALSAHSWGAAIDLNAGWNGYGAIPAPLGATGSILELVPIFESEGFAWGGYFKPQKICDGMHFELSRLDI